jgi:hypothetical protein
MMICVRIFLELAGNDIEQVTGFIVLSLRSLP